MILGVYCLHIIFMDSISKFRPRQDCNIKYVTISNACIMALFICIAPFKVYTSHAILLFVLSYYQIDDHTTDDLVFYIRGFSTEPLSTDSMAALRRHLKEMKI